ncbi:MAG: hypothetical protein BGO69_05745 [Bacteroidetes bacterium 46-16]|nr:MAG: hypothetical protein BGO69_05745 [Bacteroidetes bacterium 46-16]
MPGYFSYIAIPVTDFQRAFDFYTAITGGKLVKNPSVPFPMAYFKDDSGKNIGHIFQMAGINPSTDGPIVYLKLTEDLNETLEKIAAAGGLIIMAKTQISPEAGYWAIFIDSEGNRLALHSMK